MKRTINKLLAVQWPVLLLVATLVGCTSTPDNGGTGGGGNNNGGEYVAPDVPETPVITNLFRVDFFSTLGADEPFFSGLRDAGLASQFVGNQATPKSIFYLFDRCDFEVGKGTAAVKIAYDNKANAYFLPSETTGEHSTKGTGVVSRYKSSSIVGVANDDLHLSGVSVAIGLSKPATITLFNATFDTTEQVAAAVEAFGVELQSDGVLLAKVATDKKADVEEWLKKNFSGYRVEFAGSEGTAYDLMVLCPVMYVCRSIEGLKTINLPYWKVTMEKFF